MIFLAAPLEMAKDDIATLRQIIDMIHGSGYSLAKNWIEPQYYRASNERPKKIDWDHVCRENEFLIGQSDALIAEATGYSTFGVGYQVALAKSYKKPILILTRETPPYGAYSDGLNYGLVKCEAYDKNNLQEKVSSFLNDLKKGKSTL